MTCSRVLILHQGRILVADRTEDLERRMSLDGQVVAEIAASEAALIEAFRDLPGVERLEVVALDGDYRRVSLTPRPTSGSSTLASAHPRSTRFLTIPLQIRFMPLLNWGS